MSYALETKKRKFHRVLDSISNSTSEKPIDLSTPAKQKTLSTGTLSPTIKRVRLTPGSEDDSSSVRPSRGLSSRPSESPSTSSRPNFVPWDRSRFLERLKTFRRVDRWSPKPAAINEVQWAKRGWSCTDVMRVECVGGCGQAVVVKLPDEIDDLEEGYDSERMEERRQVREKLVEKYSRLIAEGHGEKCPWRKAGCDETIQRLPLSKPENALQGLRTRYINLLSLGDSLPSMDVLELPETLNVPELLGMLPPGTLGDESANGSENGPNEISGNVDKDPPSEKPTVLVNTAAFSLALFGWDVCGDSGAGLASCGACFRRLGLWMYKPKEDGKTSVYSRLDVVNEHLEYCPWINAKSQSGRAKAETKWARSGWEELEQAIRTAHRRRTWSENSLPKSGTATPQSSVSVFEDIDNEEKKVKDREWWARFRRIRQVLHVGTPRKPKPSQAAS
ncbi:hypothetical protein VTO42DRAFT_8277 [Malbranchea cinnamomea]